jgi:hypothetical protein
MPAAHGTIAAFGAFNPGVILARNCLGGSEPPCAKVQNVGVVAG